MERTRVPRLELLELSTFLERADTRHTKRRGYKDDVNPVADPSRPGRVRGCGSPSLVTGRAMTPWWSGS